MNRSKLKTYAPQARRDFIRAMTDRAAFYGLTKEKIEPVTVQGDVALIGGKAFPAATAAKRQRLEERVERNGFDQTMEAMAYTWFNRLVAIRYMELHGYLDHGYRVLSHPEGKPTPEIVEHAEHVDLPGLDRDEVINLKLDGTKEAELYRKLLIAQCNALHAAMPFLFERIADETELLLPDSLLHSDSLVRKLVTEIDEADWEQVEIIGWLYQFYISEKKKEVIGSVVKSEDIPAATQLFTPNWIVNYLVQNSLGRQWLMTYPDSVLKAKMEFYIEPAEQTPEVLAALKAITPETLNPEELTFLDPACGSGHILVEAYSLLKEIYLERGYRLRDIPKLILTKNLYGLEIDDRAAQLAAFALLMMARADDRNILSSGVTLNVLAIQQTDHLDTDALLQAFTHTKLHSKPQPRSNEFGFMDEVRAPLYANAPAPTPSTDPLVTDLRQLLGFFKGAKTFGSLLQIPPALLNTLPALRERITALQQNVDLTTTGLATLELLVRQAELLAQRYNNVAANPPYMGSFFPTLKAFAKSNYPDSKADLFSMFIERCLRFISDTGNGAMITMHSWMFLGSFRSLRQQFLQDATIWSMAHLGPRAFASISGEVVQTTAFTFMGQIVPQYRPSFFRLLEGDEDQKRDALLARHNRFNGLRHTDFADLPGSPVAYWVTSQVRKLFRECDSLHQHAATKQGLATTNNGLFIRLWHEVDLQRVMFAATSEDDAEQSGKKWFPCNKGGAYRRWYGNHTYLINYEKRGRIICEYIDNTPGVKVKSNGRVINRDCYFREGLTWSSLSSESFAMRYCPAGFVFETKGSMCFPARSENIWSLLAYGNSKLVDDFLGSLSPTLDYHEGPLGTIPFKPVADPRLTAIAQRCVEIARDDWNSSECSWDFDRDPLLAAGADRISNAWDRFASLAEARQHEMRSLEEDNNRLLAQEYGLEAEIDPRVADRDITLSRPCREEALADMMSFAVGCAVGRYSLDRPGLIYANSGNEGFDPAAYATFPADKDGIIPVTEEHWFADDAAARFEEFVGKAWKPEHQDENLAFVAEGLGAKANESPRQTVRRYLSDGFYKRHLSKSMYKNRPIYWFFTSGKQRAFQALVYLHRYNEGTLSRMRTEYVIPLQGKIAGRIEKLEADKAKATSTSHSKAIQKEQDKLRKQQTELISFDEKLRHYADLRIKLDLDDGVKVNYRKFADPAIGEIVADVKAVCGKEDDE